MKKAAVRKLVAVVRKGISAMPIAEQIEVYDALAVVMPTKKERGHATYIAGMLRLVEKHQLDFTKELFAELQWPGHQHNGPHKGEGQ